MADTNLNPADALLEKLGIKFEDLDKPGHQGEKKRYYELLTQSEEMPLTVERIRISILDMKNSVCMRLAEPSLVAGSQEDLELKARLKNYILLEMVLFQPDIARRDYLDDLDQLAKGDK